MVLLLAVHSLAFAATPDLTGTWRWTGFSPGGQALFVAKIKQEGSKITGTVTRRNGNVQPQQIRDGTLYGNDVQWTLVQGAGGNQFTNHYRGKVTGDVIKGTATGGRGGFLNTNGWNAAKADPATAATGTWTFGYSTQDGQVVNETLKLEHLGTLLTGTCTGRDGRDFPVRNGTFTDETISFDVVRERDGVYFTNSFKGKFNDESIKGSMEIDRGVERRKLDWSVRRMN